ncbi:hypothetical protein OB08_02500 [Microbacterium sp. HJ5]
MSSTAPPSSSGSVSSPAGSRSVVVASTASAYTAPSSAGPTKRGAGSATGDSDAAAPGRGEAS